MYLEEVSGRKRWTGTSPEIDDGWKARVDAKRIARGWTKDRMAKELGCSPSGIGKLLRPIAEGGNKESQLARRVAEIFKEPLPIKTSDWREELVSRAEELLRRDSGRFAEWMELRRHELTVLLRQSGDRPLKSPTEKAVGGEHGGEDSHAPQQDPPPSARRRRSH